MRTEVRKARADGEGIRNALVATGQLKVHVVITGKKMAENLSKGL